MMGNLTPQPFSNSEKNLFVRFLVIAFFIVLGFTFYKIAVQEVSGWFGKSKEVVVAENQVLQKDLENLVHINEGNLQQLQVIEKVNDIKITEVIAVTKAKEVIEKKVQSKKEVFVKKTQAIDTDESITEYERSQQYAQVIIDDLWDTHCSMTVCQ